MSLALYMPDQFIVRIHGIPAAEPHFVLLDNDVDRIVVTPTAALRLGRLAPPLKRPQRLAPGEVQLEPAPPDRARALLRPSRGQVVESPQPIILEVVTPSRSTVQKRWLGLSTTEGGACVIALPESSGRMAGRAAK